MKFSSHKIVLLFALAVLILIASCRKEGIPLEKHLVYEESFDETNWIINGQEDTVWFTNSYGEFEDNKLELVANGCTQVYAYHISEELKNLTSDQFTVSVNLDMRYDFSNNGTYFDIEFSNHKIHIDFSAIPQGTNYTDVNLVIGVKNDEMKLYRTIPDIKITYSKQSSIEGKIAAYLTSAGFADCVSYSKMVINSVKLYKK